MLQGSRGKKLTGAPVKNDAVAADDLKQVDVTAHEAGRDGRGIFCESPETVGCDVESQCHTRHLVNLVNLVSIQVGFDCGNDHAVVLAARSMAT
ncbi:hypothetical protein RCH23_001696 [Cryobacterium sp. CAN_C3]|nr:hypothetical protein [Cryobacterium sp. CAN_C3]